MEKKYRVVGPHTVAGHQTGEEFKASYTQQQEAYYVSGGHLKAVTGKGEKPPELQCPACVEHGKPADKKRTYSSAAELAEHYASDHPALQAPAGEEE